MNMTNHVESPYFERLPRYVWPALQAAWDKAHGRQFGTIAIYQSFCRDMDHIGYDKPSKPVMSDWIDRVQKGLVVRPGSPAGGADPALVAGLEEVLAEPIEDIVEDVADLNAEGASFAPVAEEAAAAAHPLDHQLNSEVLQLFADADDKKPELGDALAEVRENLRKDLRMACLDGVDDLTDEVVSRAQKMARQMMVEILRDLLAEMEKAA